MSVLQDRAENCGRDPQWRASFDGAIARSFGRPAVLADAAAPLLEVGAWVVVSEPPSSTVVGAPQNVGPANRGHQGGSAGSCSTGRLRTWEYRKGSWGAGTEIDGNERPGTRGQAGPERWPASGLQKLGLEPGELIHAEFDSRSCGRLTVCPDRFPRRNGVPAKKPLF